LLQARVSLVQRATASSAVTHDVASFDDRSRGNAPAFRSRSTSSCALALELGDEARTLKWGRSPLDPPRPARSPAPEGICQSSFQFAEIAMVSKNVHTRPMETRWVNEIEGTGELVSIHDTQQEARFIGQMFARREMSEHLVHDQDDVIRERTTYGYFGHPPIG
jgi:hypothetical protein